MRRWNQFRNPWEREYAMRGSLWRGEEDAEFLRPFLPSDGALLELGCGDGKFLRSLQKLRPAPIGVDFSKKALQLARPQATGPLVQADVRRLPLREGAAAFVAARYVLGALLTHPRRQAVQEILRVLRPGGTVLVEEFSREDFRYGSGDEVEPATFERNRGITTHYFERDEVPALFHDAATTVSVDERRSSQRTGEGARPRVRWRWILRRR